MVYNHIFKAFGFCSKTPMIGGISLEGKIAANSIANNHKLIRRQEEGSRLREKLKTKCGEEDSNPRKH